MPSPDLSGPATRVVDLGGAMLMPGIVDVHAHLMMGGQAELFELRFAPTSSFETLIARVGEAAAKAPEGSWIIGGQWGSDLLPKLNTLEALAALDKASQGHPVLLRDDSYHNRWCNSEALRPPASRPRRRTRTRARSAATRSGELTGMMIEAAAGIVERALGESGHYTPEMDQAAIARSIDTLNSYGVTAFLEAASMKPIMAALKGLDDRGVAYCLGRLLDAGGRARLHVRRRGRRAVRLARAVPRPAREAGLRQVLPRRRAGLQDRGVPRALHARPDPRLLLSRRDHDDRARSDPLARQMRKARAERQDPLRG